MLIILILTILFAYLSTWLINITFKTITKATLLKQWLLIIESLGFSLLSELIGNRMYVPKIQPTIFEKGLLVILCISITIFISFTIVNIISFIPRLKRNYHHLLILSLIVDVAIILLIAVNPSSLITFLF